MHSRGWPRPRVLSPAANHSVSNENKGTERSVGTHISEEPRHIHIKTSRRGLYTIDHGGPVGHEEGPVGHEEACGGSTYTSTWKGTKNRSPKTAKTRIHEPRLLLKRTIHNLAILACLRLVDLIVPAHDGADTGFDRFSGGPKVELRSVRIY